jgi:DoxX-like family
LIGPPLLSSGAARHCGGAGRSASERAQIVDPPAHHLGVGDLAQAIGAHYCVVMIAEVIVTASLAVLFTFSSLIKLVGVRQSLAIRDHLGVKPMQWRLIGLLELAGVVGVLAGLAWAPIGVAAAVGLALLLLGAIIFHVRAADSAADIAPAVIGLGLAVATAILQAA